MTKSSSCQRRGRRRRTALRERRVLQQDGQNKVSFFSLPQGLTGDIIGGACSGIGGEGFGQVVLRELLAGRALANIVGGFARVSRSAGGGEEIIGGAGAGDDADVLCCGECTECGNGY